MADQKPPPWNEAQFEATRKAIQDRFGCSEEEAVARLEDLWNGGNAPRTLSPPPGPPPTPPPEAAPNPGIRSTANKVPVFVDYDVGATILPSLPAKYALDKIKALEYVPLWYFTSEGLHDAKRIPRSTPEDTIGLLKTDEGYSLLPVKAARLSQNAREDGELNWEQITAAKHNLLNAVMAWPEKLKFSLVAFYMNLEAAQSSTTNTRALILYQAVTRRLWHAALKGEATPFDIGHINLELLATLENQIRDHDYAALERKASNVYLTSQGCTLTLALFTRVFRSLVPHEPHVE